MGGGAPHGTNAWGELDGAARPASGRRLGAAEHSVEIHHPHRHGQRGPHRPPPRGARLMGETPRTPPAAALPRRADGGPPSPALRRHRGLVLSLPSPADGARRAGRRLRGARRDQRGRRRRRNRARGLRAASGALRPRAAVAARDARHHPGAAPAASPARARSGASRGAAADHPRLARRARPARSRASTP